MIAFDYAARQQNRELLMNRTAPDFVDYRRERQVLERNVSYEDFVGQEVAPRRSPWLTENEDPEARNPVVSDKQVPVTPINFNNTSSNNNGTFGGGGGGGGGVSVSNIKSVVLSEEVLDDLVAAMLAALPIVEFTCPE